MIDDVSTFIGQNVPRGTLDKLSGYCDLLLLANKQQNLVAASTEASVWCRHILDSLQLPALAPDAGSWCDIGSGAGLPGVPIAICTNDPVTLIEPRRLRTEFLEMVKRELTLECVTVVRGKPAGVCEKFEKITARAVAPAAKLFAMAHHLSLQETIWLLPKGRSAKKELDEVRASWHGDFRLVPSRTDDASSILVAQGVRPKEAR